ncbi:Myo-inositol 2-dehydrogenase [subsurface metagenome]|nr:hypothetical protein [Hadesarchaea archaeon]
MVKAGIGLAGLGFMARVHSRALNGIPEAKIVAAWSKFPEEHVKFDEFSKKLGFEIGTYYTNIEKMLEDPWVDAVICAIPSRFAEPIANEIIRAGKPALIECPPSDTPEGIDRMEKFAKERGVKLMPGHCYRFAPCFKKSKELVDKDEIGAPLFVHFREFVPAESLARQWAPGSWIWDKDKGGPIPTMTVFCMDMARWLLNSEPVSLYATVKWQELPQLGTLGYTVSNVIKFENDVTWVNEFSGNVAPSVGPSMKMEIFGENGNAVMVDGPERVILHTEKKGVKREWSFDITRPERWGHKPQDEHFIRSVVLGHEEPIVRLQDAKKALKMSLAILESSKTNRVIQFDQF